MSAASSDTESSCGWTIISNEVLNLSYVQQVYLYHDVDGRTVGSSVFN